MFDYCLIASTSSVNPDGVRVPPHPDKCKEDKVSKCPRGVKRILVEDQGMSDKIYGRVFEFLVLVSDQSWARMIGHPVSSQYPQ